MRNARTVLLGLGTPQCRSRATKDARRSSRRSGQRFCCFVRRAILRISSSVDGLGGMSYLWKRCERDLAALMQSSRQSTNGRSCPSRVGPTSSGLNQSLASPSILRLFVGTDQSQVLRPLTVTTDATLSFPFSIPTRTSPIDSTIYSHQPVFSMRELTGSCSPCAAAPHPL